MTRIEVESLPFLHIKWELKKAAVPIGDAVFRSVSSKVVRERIKAWAGSEVEHVIMHGGLKAQAEVPRDVG
eukprot:1910962-Pleurochrysis_carterae.AAC.2